MGIGTADIKDGFSDAKDGVNTELADIKVEVRGLFRIAEPNAHAFDVAGLLRNLEYFHRIRQINIFHNNFSQL